MILKGSEASKMLKSWVGFERVARKQPAARAAREHRCDAFPREASWARAAPVCCRPPLPSAGCGPDSAKHQISNPDPGSSYSAESGPVCRERSRLSLADAISDLQNWTSKNRRCLKDVASAVQIFTVTLFWRTHHCIFSALERQRGFFRCGSCYYEPWDKCWPSLLHKGKENLKRWPEEMKGSGSVPVASLTELSSFSQHVCQFLIYLKLLCWNYPFWSCTYTQFTHYEIYTGILCLVKQMTHTQRVSETCLW